MIITSTNINKLDIFNESQLNYLLKFAQVGEWWIIDGEAHYADSTIGDMGHEAYVLSYVRNIICETMNFGVYEKYMDWDETKKDIVRNLINRRDIESIEEDKIEEIHDDHELFDKIALGYEISPKDIDIADNSGDVRVYAMENLGWKRVEGKFVQTQTLTRKDLKDIVDGLYDAYEIEDDSKMLFSIEVMANKKMYWDIPYYILSLEEPKEILQYRTSYA